MVSSSSSNQFAPFWLGDQLGRRTFFSSLAVERRRLLLQWPFSGASCSLSLSLFHARSAFSPCSPILLLLLPQKKRPIALPINDQWSREREGDITITIVDDLQAPQKSTGHFSRIKSCRGGGRGQAEDEEKNGKNIYHRIAGRIVSSVWVCVCVGVWVGLCRRRDFGTRTRVGSSSSPNWQPSRWTNGRRTFYIIFLWF